MWFACDSTARWTFTPSCRTHGIGFTLRAEGSTITQFNEQIPSKRISTQAVHGRAATAFVLVTVLLDIMALGMMLPALPKLVESFVPGDTALAARIYGVFGMSWGLMQFFGAPILGALSDRYGRRPVILLSNLGLGLDYILMALAPNLWILLIGRLIAGVTSASTSTAFAYIADITPEEQRATEFGKILAMFGIGFIAGPAIGGYLASIDPRWPFMAAAAFSLTNFTYGYFVLPESLGREKRMPFTWARANPYTSLQMLGRNRRILGLSIVSLLDSLALVALPSTFVLYATHKFGWTEDIVGFTFAGVGIGLAVVHGVLTGPVVKRLGERTTLLVGMVFGTLGFAMYGISWEGWVIWASIPLIALWGLSDTTISSLMSAEFGTREQGRLQGALASLMALAETFGPLLSTQVYAFAIQHGGAAGPWAGAPFMVAALLQLIGFSLAYICTRTPKAVSPSEPSA